MKKTLVLSLVAALLFTTALCMLPASAKEGDNLAAGKTVDILPHLGGDGSPDDYNTDLTDGKVSDTFNWADGTWFAYQIGKNVNDQGKGELTIDLGSVAVVGTVRVHTLALNGSNGAVANPKSVQLEISTNNSAWKLMELKEYELSDATDWTPMWVEFSLDNAKAQYVRLTFEFHEAFVMIDEVEVLEGDSSAAKEESSEEPSEEPSEESSEEPATSETSEEASEATSEAASEAASAAASTGTSSAATSSTAASSTVAASSEEEPSSGNGLLIGILIGAAVVVAAAGAAVVIIRKRK